MNFIAFQAAITGSAQQLPDNPVIRSVTLTAKSTNSDDIEITAATNSDTATGYILEKGLSVTIAIQGGNTNQVWVFGTADDIISVTGS